MDISSLKLAAFQIADQPLTTGEIQRSGCCVHWHSQNEMRVNRKAVIAAKEGPMPYVVQGSHGLSVIYSNVMEETKHQWVSGGDSGGQGCRRHLKSLNAFERLII